MAVREGASHRSVRDACQTSADRGVGADAGGDADGLGELTKKRKIHT